MNFFPFHPGDYMLRTAHLEPLEDLAYRRLLDLYYVNEKPIQGTSEEIARVLRMRNNAAEVVSVLREFFEETQEGWRHAHCDEVIAQYQAKAKIASENGKRGGRPKKPEANPDQPEASGSDSENNPAETQSVISANPEETGSKTNQEPITNNQNQEELPPLPPEGEVTASAATEATGQVESIPDQPALPECGGKPEPLDGFDAFWSRYPRKTAKQAAVKAWAKLKPDAALIARITESLAKHCLSHDWLKDGGQYVPHPATWLNGKRWEDEVKTPANVRPIHFASNFTNLPEFNGDEIRARTAENERLGVRRANF
ncbi:hypothetical protein D9M71_62140 [compost metagenome]